MKPEFEIGDIVETRRKQDALSVSMWDTLDKSYEGPIVIIGKFFADSTHTKTELHYVIESKHGGSTIEGLKTLVDPQDPETFGSITRLPVKSKDKSRRLTYCLAALNEVVLIRTAEEDLVLQLRDEIPSARRRVLELLQKTKEDKLRKARERDAFFSNEVSLYEEPKIARIAKPKNDSFSRNQRSKMQNYQRRMR